MAASERGRSREEMSSHPGTTNVSIPRGRKEDLCRSAKEGKWKRVLEIYRDNPWARCMKINDDGDTVLHMAVNAGRADVVENLVSILQSTNKKEGNEDLRVANDEGNEDLRVVNDEGNTPLHLAASLGDAVICRSIATIDPSLVGARNGDEDTPFFSAVRRGRKAAFLCLRDICGHDQDKGLSYCRGKEDCRGRNTETILHVAISEEYFDLAFQIIHLYKELVNDVDDEGRSPLHLLANKPSVFKSGGNLSSYDEMIYRYLLVDKLEAEKDLSKYGQRQPKFLTRLLQAFMERFQDIDIYILWKHIFGGVKMELCNGDKKDREDEDIENQTGKINGARGCQSIDGNCKYCLGLFKKIFHVHKGILIFILGYLLHMVLAFAIVLIGIASGALMYVKFFRFGFVGRIVILEGKKWKHTHSIQVLEELLQNTEYENDHKGKNMSPTPSAADGGNIALSDNVDPHYIQQQNTKMRKHGKGETPILIAAKNGITEMVEKIVKKFPGAIEDKSRDGKNIALLAAENRQQHVYELLLEKRFCTKSVFSQVDGKGNSALHIAATLEEEHSHWPVPTAAEQMHREFKWFEFIKNSKPSCFFVKYNKEGKTAEDLFTETHEKLLQNASQWIANTSQACSVVAGLFVTVTYSTAATVPGGLMQDKGTPVFKQVLEFKIFAVSSFLTFLFSVIAVVMFLTTLTSGYNAKDFNKALPRKMSIGLTTLYGSLATTLISFCASHFFVLKDWLKSAALPLYAWTCFLVILFAIFQFSLLFQLQWATLKRVARLGRSYFYF